MATDFDKQIEGQMIEWRRGNINTDELGVQNGLERPWILPERLWTDGLWDGVKESLPAYLEETGVQKHKGCNNLKSSWILCANLYFPFREDNNLLASFLNRYVDDRIESVSRVELEYAEDSPLDPATLLGEPQGKRGANQTSPDVAFIVNGGRGLVLTENKYTEHSFYSCAGRKPKYGNPDTKRCSNLEEVTRDTNNCYMTCWQEGRRTNRKYWDFININSIAMAELNRCPAATAGYQLFRQQALAEAIAQKGNYEFVISCVAYDEHNHTLINSLSSSGINDFRDGWGKIFEGKARFTSFSHQQFASWVRDNDNNSRWSNWLTYISQRYRY